MLVESYIVSIASPAKPVAHSAYKDAGIFVSQLQPAAGLTATFKKSSSGPNCLDVSSTHIFAAQHGKAVVHVYNRAKGTQEALVPFADRLSSIALVGDPQEPGILALGTENGRVILWELSTGRQVSTPQAHLQATTALAVDPTNNFLLSGSADSNVHVWSVPSLLSFAAPQHGAMQTQYAPLRSLSSHRAAITAVAMGSGHWSTNFAVSAARDKTCVVWDYRNGTLLHTCLLPLAPLCLALDPADRALYAGLEDGSVQLIDFYKKAPFSDLEGGQRGANMPSQPPEKDRWPMPIDTASKTLCVAVSYDGTVLLTGHEDGRILSWDVAKGRYTAKLQDLQAPVTNIQMLQPTGFPHARRAVTVCSTVVKPKYESKLSNSGSQGSLTIVPEKYGCTLLAHSFIFVPRLANGQKLEDVLMDDFEAALDHSSFPAEILDEAVAAFSGSGWRLAGSAEADGDLQKEVELLKAQLAHSKAAQLAHAERAVELNGEVLRLRDAEKARKRAKSIRRIKRAKADEIARKRFMGEEIEERAEAELAQPWEGEADVSTDTEELAGGE